MLLSSRPPLFVHRPSLCGQVDSTYMSALESTSLGHMLDTARKHGIVSVKVRVGDHRFKATLADSSAHEDCEASSAETDKSAEEADSQVQEVTAPVVGYYRAPKQGVSPGDRVEAGQIVGEVVALGLANDIVSRLGGTVAEVLAKDGDPVEYGQPVLKVSQE